MEFALCIESKGCWSVPLWISAVGKMFTAAVNLAPYVLIAEWPMAERTRLISGDLSCVARKRSPHCIREGVEEGRMQFKPLVIGVLAASALLGQELNPTQGPQATQNSGESRPL